MSHQKRSDRKPPEGGRGKKTQLRIHEITGIVFSVVLAVNAQITWDAGTGDYGDPVNWGGANPAAGVELRIDNGGTATITTGDDYAGGFLRPGQAGNSAGHLAMDGGKLRLSGTTTSLQLANGAGSTADATMEGSSVLQATGNITVAERGSSTMGVGSNASVTGGILRIGANTGAMGTLDLSGSWSASQVILLHPNNASVRASFNLNGGRFSGSGAFTVNANGTAVLNVNGSSGLFSVGGNFTANLGNFTLNFVADTGGVTTLEIGGAIDITGAALNVDLTAYNEPWTRIILMDGESITGTWPKVRIEGGRGDEQIVQDHESGQLVLISGLPSSAGSGMMVEMVASGPLNPARRYLMEREMAVQHLLAQRGDRFRIYKENLRWNDGSKIRFDLEEVTDPVPSLRIVDESSSGRVVLRSHKSIVVQPFTRYRLHLKSKCISYQGGVEPKLELRQYDFNRDDIRALSMLFPAGDAGAGWMDQEMEFVTDYETHTVRCWFLTANNTLCDIVFDEVYLEQLSEAGAERVDGRTVVALDELNGQEMQESLYSSEEAVRLVFELEWSPGEDKPELVLEWLAEGGNLIGREIGRFSRFLGVRPEWNGVQAEWFRQYGDSADGTHMRRDRFYDMPDRDGPARFEEIFLKPEDAVHVRLRHEPGGTEIPQLRIRRISLAVQSLGRP